MGTSLLISFVVVDDDVESTLAIELIVSEGAPVDKTSGFILDVVADSSFVGKMVLGASLTGVAGVVSVSMMPVLSLVI